MSKSYGLKYKIQKNFIAQKIKINQIKFLNCFMGTNKLSILFLAFENQKNKFQKF